MDIIKIIGVGLIALIIIIILKQYRPEFVIYVSIIAGVIILILIMDKVSAIIDLLTSLSNKTVINNEFLVLLIKITGIAFLTEFSVSICKDSGETAIANKIDIRVSIGKYNTKEEIDYLIENLMEIVTRLREMSPLWEKFMTV